MGSRPNREAAVVTAPPEEDERRALVLRIVGSRHFVKAQQLRDILLYVSNAAISGSGDVAIKEHEIACEVLGREKDFNSQDDNIVRVQISHLRKRLDEYFAGEGRNETLRLSLPRGSYVPRFESLLPESPAPAVVPAPVRSPAIALMAAAVLILAGFCAWAWLRASVPAVSSGDRLWTAIFASQNANIVVADTCLVMLQDILDTDIGLGDYLGGRYPENVLSRATDPLQRSALQLISTRQYTSLADMNTASSLVQLSHRFGSSPARIRYSRNLNVRDFKNGNFILLGSRRGVPWVQLFESQLNFAMEEDRKTKQYFLRNRAPRPGEEPAYYQSQESGGVAKTYADLALVPNLSGTGYVMILNGIGMESTEAAGELATGPGFAAVLDRLSKENRGKSPAWFEILLRIDAVARVVKSSEVVTWRTIEPGAQRP